MFTLFELKNVLERLKSYIDDQKLIRGDERIAIAVSGGLDSMCTATLFDRLGYSFTALHVNFGLRGSESDQDEAFVRRECIAMEHCQLVLVEHLDAAKHAKEYGLGIQEAARTLRYSWFSQLHKQGMFDVLVVAHHANDRVETFLINTYRVSGLRGLASIPIQRDHIIRPMIGFQRTELETWAEQEGIAYREDRSNGSDLYLRNLLRNRLIPQMEDLLPDLTDRFDRTITNLRSEWELHRYLIRIQSDSLWSLDKNGFYVADIKAIVTYPHSDVFLYQMLDGLGFTRTQCADILNSDRTGAEVHSGRAGLHRYGDRLILAARIDPAEALSVETPGTYSLGSYTIELSNSDSPEAEERVWLDPALFPLELRTWREGDHIYPLGMNGKRKLLSDLFTDLKLSRPERSVQPLLCKGSEVLWVPGRRVSHTLRTQAGKAANAFLFTRRDPGATKHWSQWSEF